MMAADEIRRLMTLLETAQQTFPQGFDELIRLCPEIGWWFNGAYMKAGLAEESLAGVIRAFELAAPLHRVAAPMRLWRFTHLDRIDTEASYALPSDKRLSSWSEDEMGARMVFGFVGGGRTLPGNYALLEAEIAPEQIVWTTRHLDILQNLLERYMDAPPDPSLERASIRAWNTLDSNARPHTWQREVIVLLPTVQPIPVLSVTPITVR